MLKECEGDGAGQFVAAGPGAGGGLNPSSTSRFVPPAVLFSGRKRNRVGFPRRAVVIARTDNRAVDTCCLNTHTHSHSHVNWHKHSDNDIPNQLLTICFRLFAPFSSFLFWGSRIH